LQSTLDLPDRDRQQQPNDYGDEQAHVLGDFISSAGLNARSLLSETDSEDKHPPPRERSPGRYQRAPLGFIHPPAAAEVGCEESCPMHLRNDREHEILTDTFAIKRHGNYCYSEF
jgi:hypothetical protein